jgi:hypothetical protein
MDGALGWNPDIAARAISRVKTDAHEGGKLIIQKASGSYEK